MTVRELIAKLSTFDPDLPVYTYDADDSGWCDIQPHVTNDPEQKIACDLDRPFNRAINIAGMDYCQQITNPFVGV